MSRLTYDTAAIASVVPIFPGQLAVFDTPGCGDYRDGWRHAGTDTQAWLACSLPTVLSGSYSRTEPVPDRMVRVRVDGGPREAEPRY